MFTNPIEVACNSRNRFACSIHLKADLFVFIIRFILLFSFILSFFLSLFLSFSIHLLCGCQLIFIDLFSFFVIFSSISLLHSVSISTGHRICIKSFESICFTIKTFNWCTTATDMCVSACLYGCVCVRMKKIFLADSLSACDMMCYCLYVCIWTY